MPHLYLKIVTATVLCASAAACTSSEARQERQNESVKSELTRETQRVCALPAGERQGEIDRLLKESGLVVVCP